MGATCQLEKKEAAFGIGIGVLVVEGGGTRVFGTGDVIGSQILQEPESMEQIQEDANGNTRSGGGAQ